MLGKFKYRKLLHDEFAAYKDFITSNAADSMWQYYDIYERKRFLIYIEKYHVILQKKWKYDQRNNVSGTVFQPSNLFSFGWKMVGMESK